MKSSFRVETRYFDAVMGLLSVGACRCVVDMDQPAPGDRWPAMQVNYSEVLVVMTIELTETITG